MTEFTLPGLRVLRAAARHGSFSTAAENLGYTQSAVSRQIALLEKAVGRALFERHTRGVRPTEAGRVLLRHADAVLGALDAARHELRGLGERRPPGRLRVGAFSTALAALVPGAMAVLAGEEPDARVMLREGMSGQLLRAVARERLDLAVVNLPEGVAGPAVPAGLELLPLPEDPLLVAVAAQHPLAGRTGVTARMLRGERWIAGSSDPGKTLLAGWSDGVFRPEIAVVARDWTAKLGLVAAGLGVTVVPGLAVPALPPAVAVVRIDDPAAVRATALVQRPGAPDAQLRGRFAEALLDVSARMSARLRDRLRAG
ncbi:LysR family transcriptional regulator [Streptomyces aidingensis]|uniref:DNA-binding transcriptional regulator, LysR family n=1 Tax=Streptomyces aidingensis TaxID=910347 RepID=A0A1I1QPW4_9ACTN|nr:LysR family transcriptional regulator [Streptomyces aidingensis]SFD24089.1 DNA-binding transcriptional regulator, LysR family [Streptomyces aidingensis]